MPNKLTPKLLEGLRAAQRNAPTTGGQKINLVKSETLGLLLDAVDVISAIRAIARDAVDVISTIQAIAREETDLGDFSKRVGEVLDEWDRGECWRDARTNRRP